MATNWADLHDAYGSAEQVPDLLARAAVEADPRARVWDDLWSRLCHQGTVYPASVAALPELARIALTRPPAAYEPCLFLVASILASGDGAVDPTARDVLGPDLEELRAHAVRSLDLDLDDTSFTWLLQTVAALDGVPVLQDRLEDVANGELEVACPVCDAYVTLVVEDGEVVVGSDLEGGGATGAPHPASDGSVSPGAAALITVAREHGRDELVAAMLVLLGEVTGPECGHRFSLADAV